MAQPSTARAEVHLRKALNAEAYCVQSELSDATMKITLYFTLIALGLTLAQPLSDFVAIRPLAVCNRPRRHYV